MTNASHHVILLTPPGRGAIATLVVEGPEAAQIVDRLFLPASGEPLASQPIGKISFGRWLSMQGEEVVVCLRSADRVEIHCHGGVAAPTAIEQSLAKQGCTPLEGTAWLRGKQDPIAAEAAIALAAARTERTAAILLDQYNGALRRAIGQLDQSLRAGDIESARARIGHLLRSADVGRHLVEPWRVVLAGRPNVGKSSLINALVGYRRSLVYDAPGTTRDVVTATNALDGWPVELADTAGLRASTDPLESAGVRLANEQLAAADAVVLVFDASQAWSGEDETLRASWPDACVVHNKTDLMSPSNLGRPAGLQTCALTGEGVGQLEQELARRLVPEPPAAADPMPFTSAQIESLTALAQLVQAGDLRKALDLLAASPWQRVGNRR